ncbi:MULTISPECIES: type II toxin-antitoxin system ParD family antitoxin [unclassified Aureimonas]|uniref:ribbon-helix-helix domain-containing protein n=1 Tax=unclassified Aureimonas TaxID=2615206 RepID=UPI00191103AE|nr:MULTISPECIES: type II toxin-antitoxin system ParD family antitoxin [unclassified Aureimonas]
MGIAGKVTANVAPDLMPAIRESVETGEFATTGEALNDALRVWHRQRLDRAQRLQALRNRVEASIADPRPSLSYDEARAEMTRFMAARRNDGDDAAPRFDRSNFLAGS